MNMRDRVLTTLDHQEPDMVPVTELTIDPPHMEALTELKLQGETSFQTPVSADRKDEMAKVEMVFKCYSKLGFELVPCDLSAPDGWHAAKNPDGTMTDEWGRILRYTSVTKTWSPFGSIFDTPDAFGRFPFPDPEASGRLFAIEQMKKLVKGDLALAIFIRDPFAHACEMFTMNNFVRWLYEKPQFLTKAIEKLADFNVSIIRQLRAIGVDLVISGGDYAEKNGPMVPPRLFRQMVFPGLRRQVDEAHRLGVKFIKHSDGNLNAILPDLAQIIDGLHSLDPTASMDIGAIKLQYGERLVLVGNVAVDTLCRKTKEEVVQETKECLKHAAPGGGYILSSSNSWFADAKLQNCLAMVETARKYGKYPIRVPQDEH
jgi:uroporphyrinogen decarboxylase